MDPRQQLSSLRRALRVLALLNRWKETSLAQLVAELQMPRTTVQRILVTLISEGFVERIPKSALYRLTPAINALSCGFSDEDWVGHVATPLLYAKTEEIGWPLMICTPVGENMIVRVSTDRATSLALDHFSIGFKSPIMYTTTGRVILAYASTAYRDGLLNLLKHSENPSQADANNAAMVDHIITKVRRRGFEHLRYVEFPEASIAVPIFLKGTVIATLAVIYIKQALTPEAAEALFVKMLQRLSAKIERSIVASKRDLDLDLAENFGAATLPARAQTQRSRWPASAAL